MGGWAWAWSSTPRSRAQRALRAPARSDCSARTTKTPACKLAHTPPPCSLPSLPPLCPSLPSPHQNTTRPTTHPLLQLKAKITKQLAAREQAQRKRNLTKYIPNVAAAVFTVLDNMARGEGEAGAQAGGLGFGFGLNPKP